MSKFNNISYYLESNLNWWPLAVPYALFILLRAIIGPKRFRHHPYYLVNLFYYSDCFINAFCGGHPRVTVSARLGDMGVYYRHRRGFTSSLWLTMEDVVNWAFKLLDGEGHCFQARQWTIYYLTDSRGRSIHIQHGPLIFIMLLWPVVMISSVLLYLIINTVGRLLIKRNEDPNVRESVGSGMF